MKRLKYLQNYPQQLQLDVANLIEKDSLKSYLLSKYPTPHNIKSDKALHSYTNDIKSRYLKKSAPLTKTLYDGKISIIHNALGTHHFISRVQGSKLKAKNEIRISSLFKSTPKEFLEMIVVHELAHFKEKEHNRSFYKLCKYMQSSYGQIEFDVRLYLTLIDIEGKMKEWSSTHSQI